MEYYSESSSESETGFEDVVKIAAEEENITRAAWHAECSSDDLEPPPNEEQPKDSVKMTARSYQLEMLKASLKENIICAMDTGSGKTQV